MDRLTRGIRGPLTVVTGAPGAGKTMLVSAWASGQRSQGTAVAWMTCEPEATEERFWAGLRTAFARAGVDPLRDPADERPGLSFLAAALAERTEPVVLILDDFRAKSGSAVADGVSYLLECGQPGLRLVVIARQDPPLPLHRYRLSCELTEIRTDALAFSERETRELLAQHEVELSGRPLARLRERTEGWAAGLRLAALSMEAQPDAEPSVDRFAGDDRAVLDYLAEEVLAAQPEPVRRALLVSSITERFNAELVVELVGRSAGEGIFAEMIRHNAFLLPLGDGWYRHQRLFGEGMRTILGQESPDEVAQLHRTAAAWFLRRDLLAEAVQHADGAGDRRLACRLIVDRLAVGKVIGLAADHGLGARLRLSDEDIVAAGPEPEPAIVEAALALSRGDDRGCARALGRGLSILSEIPADRARPARLTAAVVQLARLLWSRPGDPDIPRLTAEVEEQLTELRLSGRDGYKDLRALLNLARGSAALWEGRLAEAATRLGAVVDESAVLGELPRRTALANLSLVEALRGRFAVASDLSTKAARLPDLCPPPGGRIAAAHVALAWTHLQAYELTGVHRELDKARAALRDGDACTAALHALLRALTDFAERRLDSAMERICEAERAAHSLPWLRRKITLTGATLNVARGDGVTALAAVERAGGLDLADALVVQARIRLLRGEHHAAVRLLRPALAEGTVMSVDVRVEAWLLDALLAGRAGDASRARRSLERALRLGERGRIRLPFVLARDWLYPVLRRDPELSQSHRSLLDQLGLRRPSRGQGRLGGVVTEPHGRLSSRELDVLRNVAQLMTTEEIAEEMYLSINTIKTHLRNIYRKLAVTRRAEAVRRARQLALL